MDPRSPHTAAPGPAGTGSTLLAQDAPRYCPTELLATFALLMAGHGRRVSTDMMLGDREYAMWQLACAGGIDDDEELARVAKDLLAVFDDPGHSGMAVLGIA